MAGKTDGQSRVWFEYVLTSGRFSAWPVCWQGWAASIALIVGPLAAGAALLRTFPDIPPAALIIGVMAVSFGTVFPLAYFKGRPAKR